MQPEVYSVCTVCDRPLSEEEIKKHVEHENYYFTICDDCLKKSSDRIIKILGGNQDSKK